MPSCDLCEYGAACKLACALLRPLNCCCEACCSMVVGRKQTAPVDAPERVCSHLRIQDIDNRQGSCPGRVAGPR